MISNSSYCYRGAIMMTLKTFLDFEGSELNFFIYYLKKKTSTIWWRKFRFLDSLWYYKYVSLIVEFSWIRRVIGVLSPFPLNQPLGQPLSHSLTLSLSLSESKKLWANFVQNFDFCCL